MNENNNISDYEKDKQKKKQGLVRNEFLYFGNCSGKYDIPVIKKQSVDINKIKFISCSDVKKDDAENKDKTVHFFTYDWKFEKVYENAEQEFERIKNYYCLLSPDFSLFTNMPLALQIESVFKNRWCGAFWQSKGARVIPTVSWGDRRSFEFCFEGVEQGSIVAVCTYCRENVKDDFMLGYNEMLKRIKPSAVLCYDEPFKEMGGNVKEFLPTTYEWTKNLSWQDLAEFKWEKHNKCVSGLNPSDFKYFKYDDPLAKTEAVKCSICGGAAYRDAYGNGECKNCGWKFSKDEEKFEKTLGVSYPMLVTPSTARKQYREGKPFKATFTEFVNGLYFYSEMLFTLSGTTYKVFLKKGGEVVMCSEYIQKVYSSRRDFENNAELDGKLLKDLWEQVTFCGFMFCG